jgi:glycerol-3-phosphate O-acyltransferase
MTETISIPLWQYLLLCLTALLVIIRVVVFPLWASFWSARTRNIVEEDNPFLQLHLSPFTLSRRRVLADRLANDPQIEPRVRQIAAERGESLEKTRREAWRIAWDIVPAFNPYFYFRIGYRMARRGLRSLYYPRIGFVDEESMAGVGDEAAALFLINHRSNMDYVIANYLTACRTMLSFGVGEWSRIWPIQPLMRMAGGYFVRRDSDDPLYRMLLKRYVQMATAARVPHAIFVEGQLSRDGSVGPARLGLLSYVTEHYDPAASPDLVFMPIGINYDHVVEDQNMLRYSTEHFRAKGPLFILGNGIGFVARVLWELLLRRRSHGYACANFGTPVYFSKWLAHNGVHWPDLNRAQRYQWIEKLGAEMIETISALVPATPVPVLCRVWFHDPIMKLSADELRFRFHALCALLERGNCHLVLVQDNRNMTLEHALNHCLRRGILRESDDGEYEINLEMLPLANYYANSLSQFLNE